MIRHSLLLVLPTLILSLMFGCDVPPAEGDDDDDTPYEPSGPWEDLEFAERLTFMEEIVLPRMEELFSGENAATYPGIRCESCHGEDPSDVDYSMPNGLAPLDLDDFPLEESEDEEIAHRAEFMDQEVKPVMAGLLGMEPFPQGEFGCFACHEQE